jgi:hypothetical protein
MQKYDLDHPARALQREVHRAVCEADLPALEAIEVLSDYVSASVRGYNDYLETQIPKGK